jgi:uncharacterized lipoprotein YddW (UPF0748 family)
MEPAPVDSAPSAPVDSVLPAPIVRALAEEADSAAARLPLTAPAVVDYLWVVRSSIADPHRCDLVVGRAAALGVRGLIVQVVGRADAYYRSELLPRAEGLGDTGFDPLDYLLVRAHDAGLEVHAWMNCFFAWSAPQSPRDGLHVVHRHPEWLTWARGQRNGNGRRPVARRRSAYGRRLELVAPEAEGFYLAPANPEVRAFVASVAGEIARRYPVDGVHLDYVRFPAASVSTDSVTRGAFETFSAARDSAAADATTGEVRGRAADASGREPEAGGPAWQAFRCEQLRRFVAAVRDTLRRVRPQAVLSAAVLADTLAARARGQDWPLWVREGLLDRAFPMCYQASTSSVLEQLVAYKDRLGTAGVVPGIACYNQPARAAAAKIKAARALGFGAVALYSYDALFSQRGYHQSLESQFRAAP